MIKYCPHCGGDISILFNETINPTLPSENATQDTLSEVVALKNTQKPSVLDEYGGTTTKTGVEIAQPRYLDNRKRLHELIRRPTIIVKPTSFDREMDKFTYNGEKLAVGEGLIQTF